MKSSMLLLCLSSRISTSGNTVSHAVRMLMAESSFAGPFCRCFFCRELLWVEKKAEAIYWDGTNESCGRRDPSGWGLERTWTMALPRVSGAYYNFLCLRIYLWEDYRQVGIPYLRAKAYDYYEELGGGISPDILDEGVDATQLRALTEEVCDWRPMMNWFWPLLQSYKGKFRRIFKTIYPWVNMSFEAWLLAWNIAYLFDKTPFYRPWLSWIRVDLRRLGIEDFVRIILSQRNFHILISLA